MEALPSDNLERVINSWQTGSLCILVRAIEIVQVRNCTHELFVSVFLKGTTWHLPMAGGEHFW